MGGGTRMCQANIKMTGIFVLMEKGRVKCIDEQEMFNYAMWLAKTNIV